MGDYGEYIATRVEPEELLAIIVQAAEDKQMHSRKVILQDPIV